MKQQKQIVYINYIKKHSKMIAILTIGLVLIIANTHLADNQYRKHEKLNNKMKNLKYEYIVNKSKLMSLIGRSKLRAELSDLGVEEITTPPELITH